MKLVLAWVMASIGIASMVVAAFFLWGWAAALGVVGVLFFAAGLLAFNVEPPKSLQPPSRRRP